MTERNDPVPLTAVLDALNATTAELKDTKAEVQRLHTYGRRNRRFIWFDIALTILLTVVGGVAFRAVQSAHDANVSAAAARAVAAVATQNNRNLCLSSNIARAQQVDLWTYVINLNKQPRTAQQKKVVAEFEAHVAQIFKPRDCSHPNAKTP